MPRRAFIASIIKVTGNVNADIGVGTRIPLKKIFTWNQETKAFVSARCLRRCIREKLSEKEGCEIDPLTLVGAGAEQQLGDVGDPIRYVDDDLFGYLIPEKVPRRRSSPVKISHIISLKHTEIKPEFAARFPREFLLEYKKGFPVPFEIEAAEWLGRLEAIVSDRIGCFEEAELSNEQKTKLEKRGRLYHLDGGERYKRLRALLEILIWEGWQFPRASQSPSVPEFYYTVIALTERFTPIFGYVDVDEEDKLSQSKMENLKKLYGPLIDRLFVLNYRAGRYQSFKKVKEGALEAEENELNAENANSVIQEICNYIVPLKEA